MSRYILLKPLKLPKDRLDSLYSSHDIFNYLAHHVEDHDRTCKKFRGIYEVKCFGNPWSCICLVELTIRVRVNGRLKICRDGVCISGIYVCNGGREEKLREETMKKEILLFTIHTNTPEGIYRYWRNS